MLLPSCPASPAPPLDKHSKGSMTQNQQTKAIQAVLNPYGDQRLAVGAPGHGGAISSQREDRLDTLALQQARELLAIGRGRPPVVYDVGCGEGTMAIKFADLGCEVIACDLEPSPALYEYARRSGRLMPRHLLAEDARAVNWSALPAPDVVYTQRFLHYLRFADAVTLLRMLTAPADCHAYVSMSGLHSELGTRYPAAPLPSRFACLEREMAEKHGITEPVCLYTKEDAERLARQCGLTILQLWLSDFGNVKLIAKR